LEKNNQSFDLGLSAIGMKSSLSGPMYFEIGRIIFLLCLCSIMWAAHPDVLEITKMGVKKSLNYLIFTFEYHIDDKHLQQRNQDLGKSSFRWSFYFLCFEILGQEEAFHKFIGKVWLSIP